LSEFSHHTKFQNSASKDEIVAPSLKVCRINMKIKNMLEMHAHAHTHKM